MTEHNSRQDPQDRHPDAVGTVMFPQRTDLEIVITTIGIILQELQRICGEGTSSEPLQVSLHHDFDSQLSQRQHPPKLIGQIVRKLLHLVESRNTASFALDVLDESGDEFICPLALRTHERVGIVRRRSKVSVELGECIESTMTEVAFVRMAVPRSLARVVGDPRRAATGSGWVLEAMSDADRCSNFERLDGFGDLVAGDVMAGTGLDVERYCGGNRESLGANGTGEVAGQVNLGFSVLVGCEPFCYLVVRGRFSPDLKRWG